MSVKICYNCGLELTPKNATAEHVPAKNLYEGFGPEFKKERITVPACFDCNNLYSKIDQELRDALAVKNDNLEERMELTAKGVRSILRCPNWKDRTHVNVDGTILAVDFSYADLRLLHIKNFKALFFRKYGFPVPAEFKVEIFADGDEALVEAAQALHEYIILDKDWEVSGHPAIFKFVLKDMTLNIAKDIIYASGDFDKLDAVAGLLVYHYDMCAIVVAGRKEYAAALASKFIL